MTTLAEERFQHQLTKQELLAVKLENVALRAQVKNLQRQFPPDHTFLPTAYLPHAESLDKNEFHA